MELFFSFFIHMISELIGLLKKIVFATSYGYVSYFGLIFAFIIIALIISAFWKGAKY